MASHSAEGAPDAAASHRLGGQCRIRASPPGPSRGADQPVRACFPPERRPSASTQRRLPEPADDDQGDRVAPVGRLGGDRCRGAARDPGVDRGRGAGAPAPGSLENPGIRSDSAPPVDSPLAGPGAEPRRRPGGGVVRRHRIRPAPTPTRTETVRMTFCGVESGPRPLRPRSLDSRGGFALDDRRPGCVGRSRLRKESSL